ncbi:NAD(P)H dehydrogenase [quinone] 1 isoform X1 [Scleropages formosus]|uniref:Ribosyldihydronicotinamide dehydrogenase [quinone] n=1 Tax=Scleropages formosus TaxID=113540 RepID=A0A8C9T3S9_SCLFO|nr:NAD(P)H dehydrogenase [quinone] 1-like isoform X1 [Scleropages formosus]
MATKRSALIVYAHQSPNSFNAAARDVAVDVLQGQGCQVTVSDLYAMGFKPAATAQDIIGELQNPDHFRYNEEAMVAWQEGRLSEDISAEQRKVEEANLIIFQFPMYWFSMPAILKGWVDRVLTQGFAFTLPKMYNNGAFKDKKAILSFTTGASEPMFLPDGINGDMNVTLWPIQYGVLNFCGFQVLPPQIFWAPARSPPSVREAMLEVWRTRLGALWEETPLSFIKTDLFDLSLQTGFRLRPEVKEELQADAYGITTGHHLGKPLPPNNQMRPPPPAI